MSYTMTILAGGISGGTDLTKKFNVTGSARLGIDEEIADGQTDYQIAFDLDVSEIQGLAIVSDQDVTVETNDGTSPGDTINLVAGVPQVYSGSPSFGDNPFSVDTTDLYVTNASGEAARLQVEVVYDSTP